MNGIYEKRVVDAATLLGLACAGKARLAPADEALFVNDRLVPDAAADAVIRLFHIAAEHGVEDLGERMVRRLKSYTPPPPASGAVQ